VRARLDVLSELPEAWEERVYRWRRWNRGHRAMARGQRLPDANTEYLVYQTIVGSWPLEFLGHEPAAIPGELLSGFRDRIAAYALKAAREAKVETNWVEPDAEFEAALERFVRSILDPALAPQFLAELGVFVGRIARPGLWNALARLVVQLTAPGVPDIYQGTELWDLSLVDPDNRRPVDFAARRALLADLAGRGAGEIRALCADLLRHPADGRVKLLVTTRALHHRRRRRALYDRGAYVPMTVAGARARNAIAFARTLDGDAALTIVGRLFASVVAGGAPPVGDSWADTQVSLPPGLHDGPYRDALTGSIVELDRGPTGPSVRLSRAFANLPVAILEPA
jgi:(1->4)-alpha-D-glucan 1-alpha-D-glucosylmutase